MSNNENISEEQVKYIVEKIVELFGQGLSKDEIVEQLVQTIDGLDEETAKHLVNAVEERILEESDTEDKDWTIGNQLLQMFIIAPVISGVGIFLFYLLAEGAGFNLIRLSIKGIKKNGNPIICILGILEGVVLLIAGLLSDLVAIGIL